MDLNKLMGGMALPHGVVLMSTERVALGYYDKEGTLRLYTRELNNPSGGLKGLWTFFLESARALWKTYPHQGEFRSVVAGVLAGVLTGIPIGLFLSRASLLPLWQVGLLSTSLVVLMFLALYRFYPPFRQGLRRMARYHGAEHKMIWALEKGEVSREGVRQQPLLHPACGSNLFALYLPFCLLSFPLSLLAPGFGWLQLLILPLLFPVFGWMRRHPQHPLARRLLALGYRFQRHTLAEPGEAELEAAWRALQGLEMETPSTSTVEGVRERCDYRRVKPRQIR